jgi:hypothetical protein
MHLLITLIWSLYNVHMSWINAFYPTNIHYSYVSVKIKVIDCTKRRSLANHQQQYSSCPQRRIMGYPIHNWKSGMSKSGQPDRTLRTTDLRKTPKLCKSWGDIHYPHQQGRNTDFLFFSILFFIFFFSLTVLSFTIIVSHVLLCLHHMNFPSFSLSSLIFLPALTTFFFWQ